ncbi:MAG TPA: hypothetical protein VGC00_08520 [Thermoanaerobaculia bacterium]|jgi:MFS family permease
MGSAGTAPELGTRQIAWRLFATCWLVYALHFATDVVRELYPALALGDRLSFDLAEYCGLHPDLFETPGHGCHIGNNPGVSLLAAVPYALSRPLVDPLVARVRAGRAARGESEPPEFRTPWPNARRFYAEAWRRGLDVKLGLAAFVTQAFCMAPSSAAGVVLVFLVLAATLGDRRRALWLALVYAFGTPVFLRTGFLNHNLMLGHIAFAGLVAVWNPWRGERLSQRTRALVAGVAGGAAVLFDYSGVVLLAGLAVYLVIRRAGDGGLAAARSAAGWYALGALAPLLVLCGYQYAAFGHPFLPGQHWMPPVEFSERGYQGYELPPQPELLALLLVDHRFGLFVSMPLALLALAAPFVERGAGRRLGRLELGALLGVAVATWLFFGASNYTRLQFNTGLRYLASTLPFLFLPAALVLARLRPLHAYAWGLLSLTVSWPLAMYREVEVPLGVLDPVVRTFAGGFSLPALRTLSLTAGQYGDFFLHGVSPLPLFALAGAILYGLWSPRFRRAPNP